jgi:hypothetical protein
VILPALALASLVVAADAPATGTPPAEPPARKAVARKSTPGAAKGAKPAKPEQAGSAPAASAEPQAAQEAPAPEAGSAPTAPGPASEADLLEGRLLTERKCSKCHDLSLALNSALDDAGWKLHMKRMANRPGAAISDEQSRRIHEFLKASAARR